MKPLLALFLMLPFIAQAQIDAEMQKRLANYKQKMGQLTQNLKVVANEYCDKKVDIACKMKNGTKASPEESYDAQEISMFKSAEAKVKTCNEDQLCKIKASKEQMVPLIKRFDEKCKKGDNKYCFNHKVFVSINEGTSLMEEEARWLENHGKKKK